MPPGARVQSVSWRHVAATHMRTLRWKVPAGAQMAFGPQLASDVQMSPVQTLPFKMTGPPQYGWSGSGKHFCPFWQSLDWQHCPCITQELASGYFTAHTR